MNHAVDSLKSLLTSAVDARNGYDEALKDAEGKGMTPLFREMIDLHQKHADELQSELGKAGEPADDSGSLMTTVHRTIMSVRSLFDGLDESVLPGLIDGEERNVSKYDDALKSASLTREVTDLLTAQRTALSSKISRMRKDHATAEKSS